MTRQLAPCALLDPAFSNGPPSSCTTCKRPMLLAARRGEV
jgi:hypothetical protein